MRERSSLTHMFATESKNDGQAVVLGAPLLSSNVP